MHDLYIFISSLEKKFDILATGYRHYWAKTMQSGKKLRKISIINLKSGPK